MSLASRSLVAAFLLGVLLLTLAACGGSGAAEDEQVTLAIAAASDLQGAFSEMGNAFSAETGHAVEFNFGSTGQLAAQIASGAPFDVFAAANVSFLDDLIASGDIQADSKRLYAVGRIVLASNVAAGVQVDDLTDLLDERVRWVAIADPDHAPYGAAAREALQRAGVWEQIQPKLILGQNIRHTLQLIQLGEAEAGIVALSIADVPEVTFTVIDAAQHEPITQAIGVTTTSAHEDAARAFVDFVMSPEGQAILERYGFERPTP